MYQNRKNNNILDYFIILLTVFLLVMSSVTSRAQEEIPTRLELGMNVGSIALDNEKSFFDTETSFYPELGAWLNFNETTRIGLTTGLIYIEYNEYDEEEPDILILSKKLVLFPTELEFGLLRIEPEFYGGPKFFAQVCIGSGINFSTGDIYRNSNISSLKLGVGLISEALYFSFDIKRIYCEAKTKETLSYKTGDIKDKMDLGGYAYTIGMGMRY